MKRRTMLLASILFFTSLICLIAGTYYGSFVAPAEVGWWNSLRQLQSSPSTVSRDFLIPPVMNFVGMLLLVITLMTIRTRMAALRLEDETAPPLVEVMA